METPATAIDVKQATRIAFEYLNDLYPEIRDTLLEEVELTEDEKYWLITLSYIPRVPEKTLSVFAAMSGPRKYKLLKVETGTGKVWAMKIRNVA